MPRVPAARSARDCRRAQAVAPDVHRPHPDIVPGAPLGTALGQLTGRRVTGGAVAVLGVIALVGLIRFLPQDHPEQPADLRQELTALRNGKLWLALLNTALFAGSMFALFTYIAPTLLQVTNLTAQGRPGRCC